MKTAEIAKSRRLDIQRLKELPALPMAAQQILALLGDPDAEVDKVVSAVESDPALAARLVGLANSAFFGAVGGIKTVKQAIVRALGLDLVKALALSVAMNNVFDPRRCAVFDATRFWHRATKTATLASLLSPSVHSACGTHNKQHVYLCGLIHDLGILALVHCYPDTMARVFDEHARCLADGLPTSLARLEQDLIGADHASTGGWLARKWGLPTEIVTVIEQHAVPLYRDAHWPLVQLVGHSARWVAEIEHGGVPVIDTDHPLIDVLGIPQDRLVRIGGRMLDRNAELEDLARTLSA